MCYPVQIQEEFADDTVPGLFQDSSFDPARVWNETILKNQDPVTVISPLMTSMKCFGNVRKYFPSGLNYSIEGWDILDADPSANPLFHDYNHVVIPYCSSDLWLGEETVAPQKQWLLDLWSAAALTMALVAASTLMEIVIIYSSYFEARL